MSLADSRLAILIDTNSAVYPITIDPIITGGLSTEYDWISDSDQNDAYFGWSVSTAGDVNGDGYDDVIVGAHLYDHGQVDEGAAFAYLGATSFIDSDGDGVSDSSDNCPNEYNPQQEDTYPPQGNEFGDACECEGNFDCDTDCDGSDAASFKTNFGRSNFNNPCMNEDQCNGDFDCDNDCDGTDAALFKQDFGRSSFNNACPACVIGDWCSY